MAVMTNQAPGGHRPPGRSVDGHAPPAAVEASGLVPGVPLTIQRSRTGKTTMNTAVPVGMTRHEIRALQGCADGLTASQTARRCGLSPQTVEKYLYQARQKLGVQGSTSAVAAAYVLGVLPLPPAESSDIILTKRQRELLALIVQSQTYDQMAALVSCTPAAASAGTCKLLRVLGAKTRPHVITRALGYRLVTVEEVRAWLHRPAVPQGRSRPTGQLAASPGARRPCPTGP